MKSTKLWWLGLLLLLLTSRAAPAQTARVLPATPAAPARLRAQMARADSALAAPLRQARRTLTQARKRYAAGLPGGTQCLVLVRVQASDTSFRPVQVRVIGWRNGAVQALLSPVSPVPTPAAPASRLELRPVSFPETAVLDWTFVAANGREEGNFVGKHLDLERQLERLPFR